MFRPALILAVCLTGCSTVQETISPTRPAALIPGDPSAPSQVTPTEAIAIAESYAKHQWRPFARNILHGPDANHIRVDTPDLSFQPANGRKGWWIPGAVNSGIPYKWGGFDDPATFDQAVANGLPAGDVSSPEKRLADQAAVSAQAVGVDCSGLISRCLKLPTVHDTRQLPSVCDILSDPQKMQPGDLLNIPGRHVMLFAGWAKADRSWIYFYETGGIPEWKPALKEAPLGKLLALGYTPLRYRGMAHEEIPSGKSILSRAAKSRSIIISDPVIGDP